MIALPRIAPGGPLRAPLQIWATLRAEIAMQWRRWGLWLAFGCVAALLLLLAVQTAIYILHPPSTSIYVHFPAEELDNTVIYGATAYGVMFFGLLAALLVVDRLERDRRLGILELQRTVPQGYASYALGKFLGNYVAVLVPILITYLLCVLMTVLLGWSAALLMKFFLVFGLVFMPSSLAAVSLTLLLSSFLPLRVVQVGFSLLWFEFCIGIGWHGLAYSIFNPSGVYVYPVIAPIPQLPTIEPNFHTSPHLALLNIMILLLTALVALFLTYGSLTFQRLLKERV